MKRTFFSLALVFSLVGFATSKAHAAYDIFMQITGLTGESLDKNHLGWIDVYSFSHGMSKVSGGAPYHAEFSVMKRLDKTSPPLDLKINQGTLFSTITFEFQKLTGSGPVIYYRVVLNNATVTSVSSSGSAGSDEIYENISVNYQKISWTYYPIDQYGKVGGAVSNYWDVSVGKGG